jgi:hypothetical protein
MKIGTISEICSRVHFTVKDDIPIILFRTHPSTTKQYHHGKPVPYINAGAGDPQVRYYFCGHFVIPLATYLPYLETTKDLSDADALKLTDDNLDAEGAFESYKLAAENTECIKYPKALRNGLRDRCILKLLKGGMSAADVANLMMVDIKRATNVAATAQIVSSPAAARPVGVKRVSHAVMEAPEYKTIKNAADYARRRAHALKIGCDFLVTDAIPTMYDINKIPGTGSGDLVVPKVCPVLRVRLEYNEYDDEGRLNKSPYVVRVWRKTPGPDGMAPMDKNNVSVMSTAASWAIEGAYASKKLANFLGVAQHAALAEWQAKYGTRTVPRETKIGRPSKKN